MAEREINCLASAIWHEARGETRRGQVAIAEVVIARTRYPSFPKKPCAVVAQPNQFSFVRHGRIPEIPIASARKQMRDLARLVVNGVERSGLQNAFFFRAKHAHPNWRFPRVGRIGDHIFYGWPTSRSLEDRT